MNAHIHAERWECDWLQVNWDKELDEEAERQRRRKKEAKQQQQARKTIPNVAVPQLLPKPKGSTSPKPGRTQGDSNKIGKTTTQDLLGLGECWVDSPCILLPVIV
jgi:stromal membrane-associated protein